MLMKQHSYTSYNLELAYKNVRLNKLIDLQKKEDSSEDYEGEIIELEKELTKDTVSFPNNITVWNFTDYLLIPTLVYELEYPRTSRFRLWFFVERAFTCILSIGLLYFVIEHWVNPIIEEMGTLGFVDSLFSLLLPFMLMWLLGFFIIFEVSISDNSASVTGLLN